jgi:hypothetical protein
MMHQWNPTDHLGRDAAGDLLAAFVLCGWEKLMPLAAAMEVADDLARRDPMKAQKLSGLLVRGEQMPPDLAAWVAQCRAARSNEQSQKGNDHDGQAR